MEREGTLGVYTGFPEKTHYNALSKLNAPEGSLKRATLNVLYRLNGRRVEGGLPGIVEPGIGVILEFGVADGLSFHYLDAETLRAISDAVGREGTSTLDFLCIARYYVSRGGRRRALRFDYYLLRFIFSDGNIEVQVFHERGLQRTSAEDLVNFLIENINLELLRVK